MQLEFKTSRQILAAIICLFIIQACSKDSALSVPPDKVAVKVTGFEVDDNSTLLRSAFAGKPTGEIYATMIPQPDAPSGIIIFKATTTPADFALNLKFFVKNDDGSTTDPSTYSLTGKNVTFFKQGIYKISASVPAGELNKVSDTSREIRILVTSNIPDTNFRAKLKTFPGLVFKDEVLDTTSALSPSVPDFWLSTADMSNLHIQSFEGINYFKNLAALTCNGNDITDLNIVHLAKLQFLECWSSPGLTKLDLTANTDLVNISIANNSNLQTLRLNNLHHLDGLNFSMCKVDTIDLSGLESLRSFASNGNPLNSLNLTGSPLLESVYASLTNAMTVDIRGLHSLSDVSVSDGPLNSLLIDTLPGSYPYLGSLYVPHAFQCNPSLKTLKTDLGSNIWIVLEDGALPTVYDFNPLTSCPN